MTEKEMEVKIGFLERDLAWHKAQVQILELIIIRALSHHEITLTQHVTYPEECNKIVDKKA